MTRRQAPPMSKEEAIDFYGYENVQKCPQCGTWYSGHSPPTGCFGCAVGLEEYKE